LEILERHRADVAGKRMFKLILILALAFWLFWVIILAVFFIVSLVSLLKYERSGSPDVHEGPAELR